MAFQFSLATVLRVRQIVEEHEERALKRLSFEISEAVRAIEEVAREITEADAMRISNRFENSSGGEIQRSYGLAEEIVQKKIECQATLVGLEARRSAQIAVYESARRDRETLTDMRGKKLVAYDGDMARREQKLIDDNYIARRGRH